MSQNSTTGSGNPNNDFLIVNHRYMNFPKSTIDEAVENSFNLQKYASGRTVIPALEGDPVPVEGSDDIIFTHKQLARPSVSQSKELIECGKGQYLEDFVAKAAKFKQDSKQKVVYIFDLKPVTDRKTIIKTVSKFLDYGITDLYFDAWFGEKLDVISEINERLSSKFKRIFHYMSNAGALKVNIGANPKKGYDMIAVPDAMSFSMPKEPIMYNSVGSVERIRELSEHENVRGVYARLEEGSGIKGALKMFFNSVSNKKHS